MTKIFAWLGALVMLLLTAVPAHADCDKCEDLCRLMDEYMQKEKGIELYRQYAASTPKSQRKKFRTGITVVQQVEIEFGAWTWVRKLPCVPLPPPPGQQASDVVTDAETVTQDDSCAILYKDKKLEGQNLKDFEKDKGCKPLSDAIIAHETVHQEHCMRAYHEDHEHAAEVLTTPENMAESELQAWSKHKEVVGEAIRKIIREKGCGWQPTKRQQNDPHAIPSLKQTQDMEKRGWKAAKALAKNRKKVA